MWQAIPDFVAQFEQNAEIRCLVITGAGTEAFAAGADISEFEANRATEEAAKVYDNATRMAVSSIIACAKPVVAAIRGICFGGGVALATACDLRLASADARFCIPAARLGIAYGTGGTSRLVQVLGSNVAAEMLITARVYSAHEALACGLVHQIATNTEFDGIVESYTAAIAANAPLSMTATKRAIQAVLTRSPSAISEAELAAGTCAKSLDYEEGRAAFMQKREPRFQGH